MDEDPLGKHRSRLFALGYRMLGSAAEAEDVLQDAWLRLSQAGSIDDAGAWLTTTVTRLCLDRLKSARARRETYVGPWLPEPIATPPEEIDPQSVSLAFLTVLERLSPTERAVFLLRDVFELEHAEIAKALGLNDAAVRQLHHRAKQHVAAERPRFAPSREKHAELLARFAIACRTGDADALRALLTADARAHADGGGKVRAARQVIEGQDRVARFIAGLVKKGELPSDGRMVDVNGWPALLLLRDSAPWCIFAIEGDGEQVSGLYVIMNPDKLGAFV